MESKQLNMKEKIIKLIEENSSEYWEGKELDELTVEEEDQVFVLNEKLAYKIINLFDCENSEYNNQHKEG